MGKRGPAPKGEYPAQTSVLSVRITQDLRSHLEEAVRESAKTLSREVEHRLRRSFYEDEKIEDFFGSRRDYAIMKLIHAAIISTVNIKAPDADWIKDPYLFSQIYQNINTVLEMFRPEGEVPQGEEGLDYGGNKQGRLKAALLLKEIKEAPPGIPLKPKDDRERLVSRLKADLGNLAEDAKLPFKRVAEIPDEHRHIAERARVNKTSFDEELKKEKLSVGKKRKSER